MALTGEDLHQIKLLLVESNSDLETRLTSRIGSLESRMDEQFETVFRHIDGLSKQNLDREQEYLIMRERIDRIEKKCA